MHEIHWVRLFGNDLVARAHNGTDHLRDLFASATEPSLKAFIDDRLTLIGDTIADALIFAELQQPQPQPTIEHLWQARCVHRQILASVTPLLQIREAAAELVFQTGEQATEFLAGYPADQRPVWDYLDDLLITDADELTKARGCVSRLSPQRDGKLRDAIVAIHGIRAALSTMFCQHDEADHAYIAALEVLTGVKQPAPVPSTLTQSHASVVNAVPGTKKKPPPPTVH